MKCSECKEREAEYLYLDDIELEVLCEECMHFLIHEFGENRLDYWSLEGISTDLHMIIDRLNRKMKWLNDMRKIFHKEIDTLKERLAKIQEHVERMPEWEDFVHFSSYTDWKEWTKQLMTVLEKEANA